MASLLTPTDISLLLKAEPITDRQPWASGRERKVEKFYRGVVREIERQAGVKSRNEWDHYGSGYASFIDAWFYAEHEGFRRKEEGGECYSGLSVLFSRLSPYYVVAEGVKFWHDTGGSSYLPCLEFVDQIECDAVVELAESVQALLLERGLFRLTRSQLAEPLPKGTHVPTILCDPPYSHFDALFHWED